MCTASEEGNTQCLSIFDTQVKKFPPTDIVPHMGWNNFSEIKGALLKSVTPSSDVYYVHSFYAEVCENTTATCNYIKPFSAAMQNKNFYATQFHPEKSAGIGAQILKNFLEL
jgi:glutamine amidotransferase